jgi:hypothetical protein
MPRPSAPPGGDEVTNSKIIEELLKLLPPCGYPVSMTTIRNQLCSRLRTADQSKIESAIILAAAKGSISRLNGGAVLTRVKS